MVIMRGRVISIRVIFSRVNLVVPERVVLVEMGSAVSDESRSRYTSYALEFIYG